MDAEAPLRFHVEIRFCGAFDMTRSYGSLREAAHAVKDAIASDFWEVGAHHLVSLLDVNPLLGRTIAARFVKNPHQIAVARDTPLGWVVVESRDGTVGELFEPTLSADPKHPQGRLYCFVTVLPGPVPR